MPEMLHVFKISKCTSTQLGNMEAPLSEKGLYHVSVFLLRKYEPADPLLRKESTRRGQRSLESHEICLSNFDLKVNTSCICLSHIKIK